MANYINGPFPEHPIRNHIPEFNAGDYLIIDNNTVLNGRHACFSAKLPEGGIGEGKIRIGHGRDCYAATHMEITRDKIEIYHQYEALGLSDTFSHGVELRDYITVSVDVSDYNARITLATASGTYRNENVSWCGRQGQVWAHAVDVNLKDVKFSWLCDRYDSDIWFFGDSYFSTADDNRWPYYMRRDGFAKHFMTGYPGMACERGVVDFKLSLTRGKPKIAVWCLGMNNGDKDGKINEGYLSTTTEFLALCRDNGITPVIATIPSTPVVENRYKNEWIRAQGVRYIDFAPAVGGDANRDELLGKKYIKPTGQEAENSTGAEWYPDMLSPDLVHPDPLGANALYMAVLRDLPEIAN